MSNESSNASEHEQIMALRSCTNAIEMIVNSYGNSQDNRDQVERCISSIEMRCSVLLLAGSAVDVSPYRNAVDLGRTWLASESNNIQT